MDQYVIAGIGFLGILVPVLFSTRFGNWRLLHQIQEESKTYDAIPELLTRERAVLAVAIKRSVENYEDRRLRTPPLPNLALWAWAASFSGTLLISLLKDGPENLDNFFNDQRPLLWAVASTLIVIGLVMLVAQVAVWLLWVFARIERTRPFVVWVLHVTHIRRKPEELEERPEPEDES